MYHDFGFLYLFPKGKYKTYIYVDFSICIEIYSHTDPQQCHHQSHPPCERSPPVSTKKRPSASSLVARNLGSQDPSFFLQFRAIPVGLVAC